MSTHDLNEATQLYETIGKYLPEVPDDKVLDYINSIIENIKKSGKYEVYFDAIQLMTGETFDTLTKRDPQDVLELFINSLVEWHIVELSAFFRSVGYKI